MRNYLLVTAAFLLPLLLLRPLQNAPVIDDWTYAWAVENLLDTGTLKILDWSTSVNVAQVLWGALFCLPFGFSFSALRLSTWVLSFAGLAGLYLMLRELGASRSSSLIGTAVLALSPFYFLFSFSFMTDIPAITFTTWSLFCFVKWLGEGKMRWLAASSSFTILTIATRLTGLTIPAAMAAFLIFDKTVRRKRAAGVIAAGVIPVLFAAAMLWWHSHHTEHRADLTWIGASPQGRTANLQYGLMYLHQWLLITVAYSVAPLGLLLAPLAVGCWRWLHYKKALIVLGVVLLLFGIGAITDLASPADHGAAWILGDLAGAHTLTPGPPGYAKPAWAGVAAFIGVLCFCMAVSPTLSTLGQRNRAAAVLWWLLLMQAVFTSIVWLWDPRYMLALLPPLIGLILSAAPVHRPKIACATLGLFAVVSVGALHDDLEYNRALWQGVDYLRGMGIPPARIDGGYVVNGWLQYAHKEQARLNGKGEVEVEFVNAQGTDFNYQISNTLKDGWIKLKEIPYGSWLGTSGRLYVLEARR